MAVLKETHVAEITILHQTIKSLKEVSKVRTHDICESSACIKGTVNVRNINNTHKQTHTHTHTHKYVTRVKQNTVSVLSESEVVYFLTIWFLIFTYSRAYACLSCHRELRLLFIRIQDPYIIDCSCETCLQHFFYTGTGLTAAWTTNKSNLI